MAKITKSNKYLEDENVQLNTRIINLEKLVSSEQEKRIQLEQYGRREMFEVFQWNKVRTALELLSKFVLLLE